MSSFLTAHQHIIGHFSAMLAEVELRWMTNRKSCVNHFTSIRCGFVVQLYNLLCSCAALAVSTDTAIAELVLMHVMMRHDNRVLSTYGSSCGATARSPGLFVCLFASISPKLQFRSSPTECLMRVFLVMAVVRSSFGGVPIYVVYTSGFMDDVMFARRGDATKAYTETDPRGAAPDRLRRNCLRSRCFASGYVHAASAPLYLVARSALVAR